MTFYATGWQSSFAPLADGQVATSPQDSCQGTCQVTALNTPAPPANFKVSYAGAAPGIVAGVTQFNVQLGTTGNTFEFGITLNIFALSSFTQTVWYKP